LGSGWHRFIDDLRDTGGQLASEELKGLVAGAKGDSDEFIRRQGEKLELYLDQLAQGMMTKAQFEGYVLDIRDLTEMQSLKMSVSARARAQNFAKGITALVINGLLTLI